MDKLTQLLWNNLGMFDAQGLKDELIALIGKAEMSEANCCHKILCAILQLRTDDSPNELFEFITGIPDDIGLYVLNANSALQDNVIDIEVKVGSATISGYIRLDQENQEWSLENSFEVYNNGEHKIENHKF